MTGSVLATYVGKQRSWEFNNMSRFTHSKLPFYKVNPRQRACLYYGGSTYKEIVT